MGNSRQPPRIQQMLEFCPKLEMGFARLHLAPGLWVMVSPHCHLCLTCRLNLHKARKKGPAFPRTVLGQLKLRLGEISLLCWKSSPLVLGEVGCPPR